MSTVDMDSIGMDYLSALEWIAFAYQENWKCTLQDPGFVFFRDGSMPKCWSAMRYRSASPCAMAFFSHIWKRFIGLYGESGKDCVWRDLLDFLFWISCFGFIRFISTGKGLDESRRISFRNLPEILFWKRVWIPDGFPSGIIRLLRAGKGWIHPFSSKSRIHPVEIPGNLESGAESSIIQGLQQSGGLHLENPTRFCGISCFGVPKRASSGRSRLKTGDSIERSHAVGSRILLLQGAGANRMQD